MSVENPNRCHRCGMFKTEDEAGFFYAWKVKDGQTEHISWFCTDECRKIWIASYADKIEPVA